ncbi:MAG: (d)CMP kinase [Gemmatimonadota bacterium]
MTLDGPAGAGKSSTAREVARLLGFRHLDSGALYRGLTCVLVESGLPPAAWKGLGEAELDAFQIHLHPVRGGFAVMAGERLLPDASLRTPEVNARVPGLATLGAVRKWLLSRQRAAGASGALVADGRDMGTVVFPQARVKVFLVADLEERARRRLLEQGIEPTAQRVIQEAERLASRDGQDEGRKEAPLRKAPDAHELDTTGISFQEQVDAIVGWVEPWLPPGWEPSPVAGPD